MTIYVNIDKAKTRLSWLLEQVSAGERVVISWSRGNDIRSALMS